MWELRAWIHEEKRHRRDFRLIYQDKVHRKLGNKWGDRGYNPIVPIRSELIIDVLEYYYQFSK